MRKVNLTGKRFGRWVVIKPFEPYVSKFGTLQYRWLCKCDCGTILPVHETALLSGNSKSCGCIRREMLIERHRNEAKRRSREDNKQI